MAAGKTRSTRRLRSWIVEQISSGKFPGLVWDDDAKTMFRIPWKHAGKQDFRKDEDAAIFKAWAEFKGKLADGEQANPAFWKTRLRCALNKSVEFSEVMERAQLDISEPYKVYRLVPISEQGLTVPEKKCKEKSTRRSKRRSRDSESDDSCHVKQIKKLKVKSEASPEDALLQNGFTLHIEAPDGLSSSSSSSSTTTTTVPKEVVDEITLRIEESFPSPAAAQDSFCVAVYYLGQEVLTRQIQGTDVRIMYLPSSMVPPTPVVLIDRFPRIPLPQPPSTLPAGPELQALSTLLPYMEKGVVLTSTAQGVYGKRFCQGRVFWTGPHTTTPELHKMERNVQPMLLFSKETFKQQLDQFHSNGGERPQCGFTLCFGEELNESEDPARKLIIVQVKITLPWAEQQVQNAQSLIQSISLLQSLASQSPLGEITLNLVTVPSPGSETNTCGTV